MEYYSAIKKENILLFATTLIDLESTMLIEISQTEKYKYRHYMFSLKCGSKNVKRREIENSIRVVRAGWWGKWENVGKRIQTSSYKRHKFLEI